MLCAQKRARRSNLLAKAIKRDIEDSVSFRFIQNVGQFITHGNIVWSKTMFPSLHLRGHISNYTLRYDTTKVLMTYLVEYTTNAKSVCRLHENECSPAGSMNPTV